MLLTERIEHIKLSNAEKEVAKLILFIGYWVGGGKT